MIGLAAGVPADAVTIDRDHHRASAMAAPLRGATVATYRMLEQRVSSQAGDWDIAIIPPQADLPLITFGDGVDSLDPAAREATLTTAWAARRWNIPALAVPGLPENEPATPTLGQRRALVVAAVLREQGITALPGRPASQSFRLTTPVEGSTR